MEYHGPASTGSLMPPQGRDADEEMSDAGDGESESQYHSATEQQASSPRLDGQQQPSQPATQEQDSSPNREHTPLFLGGSSDTSFDAQWEADSARSEDDKPVSDRMSTPRARAQSLPMTDGDEDEVMAGLREEGHTQHRPSPFAGYQSSLDESVTPRWEEVERPISIAPINARELPHANWGNGDDGKMSFYAGPSTEGKKRANDDNDTIAHPKKRQNDGKRYITESLGWMTTRQATRQTATAQVELQRHYKSDRAELKSFTDNIIRKLHEEKALLEEQLSERGRELQTVVKTMEVKDEELEERAAQFSKERKAFQQQIEELELVVENLKTGAKQKERQWIGERKELEDALARSTTSYEEKLRRTHEDAMKSLQDHDGVVQEEIRSLQEGYETKIANLEAYIAKIEEKEKEKKISQVANLQKQIQDQGKTIESLKEIVAKAQKDEEIYRKEKDHLEQKIAKFRQDINERAKSNQETEHREAEKEAGDAVTLQRERRAEQRAEKESSTRENDVDVPNKHKNTKGSNARPQDRQHSSTPKGKRNGSDRNKETHAPARHATPSSRRSVRPLPKNNGKWRDLRHHALNQARDTLLAVEIESDTDSEEVDERRSKKDKQRQRQSDDEDTFMASDEEVEEAIMPKRKDSEVDEDEDASMASDEAESPKQHLKPKATHERTKHPKTRTTTEDNRYSSGEESNVPFTKKDLASAIATAVKEALQATMPSPPQTEKKRRRSKRTVNAQLIAEKRADGEGERALYCELVRDTFKQKFSIEYDDEFVTHEAARDEDLEAYFQDNTKGPNPEDLHIDARHKISSSWNKAVIRIMVDAVREYQAEEEEKFTSLPERSDDYIEELVIQRLERLKGIWKKGQAKLKENGEVESPSEVEERMAAERELVEKIARAATRRRARYDRRKETLLRMVEIKRETGEEDSFIWEWLLEVVETLGENGMSSDESDVDDRTGQVVYRVNRLPWRRDVSKEMDYIDQQRTDAHLFSKKGSKPITRFREGGNESRRPELEELPKVVYNKEWLGGLPSRFREKFKFSPKQLEWMKIFGRKQK